MKTPFYTYLVYLILGLAILNFVPDKAKPIVVLIIVLGGIAHVEMHGGFSKLYNQLTGKG